MAMIQSIGTYHIFFRVLGIQYLINLVDEESGRHGGVIDPSDTVDLWGGITGPHLSTCPNYP